MKEYKKLLLGKDYTLGQSIVLSERVLKSIVEKNEKLKRTHVSIIPGLLTLWGGLEANWKWIISENIWTNGCILSKVYHIV